MGVRVGEPSPVERRRAPGPGVAAGLTVFVLSLLLLVANGRAIGDAIPSGVSAWLLQGALALTGAGLELDATGKAIVGKLLAALFAALAGAALFAAVARRHPTSEARWAAFALVGGTTLAAAAQAFSGEAAAASAVAIALWLLARAEAEDAIWSVGGAGLPLALAVALQPSTLALALVLAAVSLAPRPRAVVPFLACALPGALLAAFHGLQTAARGPDGGAPADPGPLALLASPAKGLVFFAPVALVGMVGLARALAARPARHWHEPRPGRALPLACGLAALAHLAQVAATGGWAEGTFWGPRLLAPAWPVLLLFLPEGLAALKLAGTLLVLVSFAVQALGALSYDGRWDRLNRDRSGRLGVAATWNLARSPIVFQARERTLRPALIGVEGRRLVSRERHVLPGDATTAALVTFQEGRLRPTGADPTMEALRLEKGAQVAGDRLELRTAGDGIAFRVREGARARVLEVRVVGSGRGTLGLGEGSIRHATRWRERAVSGGFRLRFGYRFAESGDPELVVALRSGGPLAIESVALVPPTEPEKVFRLP